MTTATIHDAIALVVSRHDSCIGALTATLQLSYWRMRVELPALSR